MRTRYRFANLFFSAVALSWLYGWSLYAQPKISESRIKENVVRINELSGTPAEIRLSAETGLSVNDFVSLYARAFGLSTENELTVFESFSDELGQTHHKIRQTYKGVELFGIQFLVHEKKRFCIFGPR